MLNFLEKLLHLGPGQKEKHSQVCENGLSIYLLHLRQIKTCKIRLYLNNEKFI